MSEVLTTSEGWKIQLDPSGRTGVRLRLDYMHHNESCDLALSLVEARVLLVELERAIEAAIAPRSEWVTE